MSKVEDRYHAAVREMFERVKEQGEAAARHLAEMDKAERDGAEEAGYLITNTMIMHCMLKNIADRFEYEKNRRQRQLRKRRFTLMDLKEGLDAYVAENGQDRMRRDQ